jgi:hypothetical protein
MKILLTPPSWETEARISADLLVNPKVPEHIKLTCCQELVKTAKLLDKIISFQLDLTAEQALELHHILEHD